MLTVPDELVHSRLQVTITSLAEIPVDLQVPLVFTPLTWQIASVARVDFDRRGLRGLPNLLDRPLRALLQQQLAAVGIAHVDNADDRQREDRRDQRQFDHRGAAVVAERLEFPKLMTAP